MDTTETAVLPVRVGQTIVHARVALPDRGEAGIEGEAKVAFRNPDFADVAQGIEEMTKTLVAVFDKIAPDKVAVEFNVGISAEGGKLVALFFDTTVTGSLKVSLQWGKGGGGSGQDDE